MWKKQTQQIIVTRLNERGQTELGIGDARSVTSFWREESGVDGGNIMWCELSAYQMGV